MNQGVKPMIKVLVLTVAVVFSCFKAYAMDTDEDVDQSGREPDRRPAILHEPSDVPVGENAALYQRDEIYKSSEVENR